MRLGSNGALTIETFASRGHFLNTLGVPCCLTLCYRNPRVASLRLAERHNTRGFRPLTRVKPTLTNGLVLLSLLEWVFVSYTGFDAPYGVERGSRVSRRGAVFFWSWGHVGSLFALFSHFSRIFWFSALILAFAIHSFRFFLIFLRFFLDLGWVSGGFFNDF